jgi:hypothetical protein
MELRLAVATRAGEKISDAAPYLALLREELRNFGDVELAEVPDFMPNGAKGIGSLAVLVASLPASGVAALFRFLRSWVTRTGRTLEVSIDGDIMKIGGATREQQDRVIEAWLDYHVSGS